MNLTPLQGFLAALADSNFSPMFYAAAAFQLVILVAGCFAGMRHSAWYRFGAAASHLLLTLIIVTGFYYARQPVA